MMRTRWRKLGRDLDAAQGRMIMIVVAIAISIAAVGAILSAYSILSREMTRNYLETNPAAAQLAVDRVDGALLEAVRQQPGIADAEAGAILAARVEVEPERWLPMTLFVIEDFTALRINRFGSESGAWPPPDGSILIERTALPLTGTEIGDALRVQVGNQPPQSLRLAGLTHDPGLAPAWQEQTVYAYATPATMALLQGDATLTLLKITVDAQPLTVAGIEATATQLAAWLQSAGRSVGEIRIPPPGRHPHQAQMEVILLMFTIFSLLALVLSGVLTATLIGGLLAEQVRQFGVMKAIGARSGQIARLYLVLVAVLGLVAVLLGIPLGLLAGRALAGIVAELLNLTIDSERVAWWVFATQVGAGLLVPLLITLIPIRRFARITVREALQDFGVRAEHFGERSFDAWLGRIRFAPGNLMLAIRNVFRRRARLALTLSLLALAGGLFIAALNVQAAWEQNIQTAIADRRYDLEIRLNRPLPQDDLLPLVREVAGVATVEPWNLATAAPLRADRFALVRTYPDGGHASFNLRSLPADSALVDFTVLAGRLLQPTEEGTVLLNHSASARFPEAQVGKPLRLLVNEQEVTLRVVGIVRELMNPATAYVTPQTFAQISGAPESVNALRIVFVEDEAITASQVVSAIEQRLAQNQVNVRLSMPTDRLAEAIDGHSLILIIMLLVVALIMAVVGLLGLASAISTSVIERTREFGIMRAIGARSSVVRRNVISESLLIGLLSWVVAIGLSLPLALAVGQLVGQLAFGLPLPLLLSPLAVVVWLGLISLGALLASLYPANQAARLTVRETLAYV
jgi:putative ABC transport system permease protein